MWEIDKEESSDNYLELNHSGGWYHAGVKWDGCIDLRRVHNVQLPITNEHPQLVDYIHFCDLDEEIKRLQELRAKAKEFFGESWG